MRWIKHLTSARKDPKMTQILEEFGAEAYGVYWLLCEEIGGTMEKNSEVTELVHSDVKWASMSYCSARVFRSICKRFEEIGLIDVESISNRLKISIPKLLKYRDEYSKKSGHAPDSKADQRESRDRGEGEQKEKPKSADNPKPKSRPSWALDETYVAIVEIAKQFWPDAMEEDFTEAHLPWRKLSLDQKLEATHNLREKQATEPANGRFVVKNFARYLSTPEWKRKARDPTGGAPKKPTQAEAALALMKKRIERGEAPL